MISLTSCSSSTSWHASCLLSLKAVWQLSFKFRNSLNIRLNQFLLKKKVRENLKNSANV
jgi:hypothetical protein